MPDWAAVAAEACTYRHAMQHPGELAQVLEIVAGMRPAVIVEIGSQDGGTLFCWRQVPGAAVLAITAPVADQGWVKTYGGTVFFGDSHAAAARSWLGEQLRGRPVDVLFIDGDHSYEGVRADFADYSPLVRDGGLVLIHDVASAAGYAGGVRRFWRETGAVTGAPVIAAEGGAAVGFGLITLGKAGWS